MIIFFLIIIGAQLLIMFFIFLIEQFLLDNIFVELKIKKNSGFFDVQKVQQFILTEKSLLKKKLTINVLWMNMK